MIQTSSLKTLAQKLRKKLLQACNHQLGYVLDQDTAKLRGENKSLNRLRDVLSEMDRNEFLEKVAYTWFNRLIALRFMDVNNFQPLKMRIISPFADQSFPEILVNAKRGYFPEGLSVDHEKIQNLLDGVIQSHNAQEEVFNILLLAVCQHYQSIMPFLFEPLDEYMDLLMPPNSLDDTGILADVRSLITEENGKEVEIIGWLYQFYISERKAEIDARNDKISTSEIPAKTQLFTPHWIVKYLVENSLGRLWLRMRPHSTLRKHMKYYVENPDADTDSLEEIKIPEDIKLLDPACGSGHILVYAFDVLTHMYEEEGYSSSEIPSLIFTHNLFGVDIDSRAAALASFALMMKARAYSGRFFRKAVQPHILAFQNVSFSQEETNIIIRLLGKEKLPISIINTLNQWEYATTFGSLIRPKVREVDLNLIHELEHAESTDIFHQQLFHRASIALKQADILSKPYHVVVANPPYMGNGKMNGVLKKFVGKEYKDANKDLFASFMVRGMEMIIKKNYLGMINQQAWMFLSSYEKLRVLFIDSYHILSMIHLGPRAFEEIGGEVVQSTVFILSKSNKKNGIYHRLVDYKSASEKERRFLANDNIHKADQSNFSKIPGSPIAYWVSKDRLNIFVGKSTISELYGKVTKGVFTGNNEKYLRRWYELAINSSSWKKYNKAGGYRKWYGLAQHLIDWRNDGFSLKKSKRSGIGPAKFFGEKSVVWSGVTSGDISFRVNEASVWFDDVSPGIIDEKIGNEILGFLNSNVVKEICKILNPTHHYQIGDIRKIPIKNNILSNQRISRLVEICLEISKFDWNRQETSWDFKVLPIYFGQNLRASFNNYLTFLNNLFFKIHTIEESLNKIFIIEYQLEKVLSEEVKLSKISILQQELDKSKGFEQVEHQVRKIPLVKRVNWALSEETLLPPFMQHLSLPFKEEEIMKQLISYAVGCMFGRYALDKPGLILANQGETIQEYLHQIPNPIFKADEDNVIPVLAGDWFPDDIVECMRKWLKVAFGKEQIHENFRFLEEKLGKELRAYFVKDFYKDHLSRYNKRPIYWMFASPKKSFQALIYMHRYQSDTISRLLNEYLRPYQEKLQNRRKQLEYIIKGEQKAHIVSKARKEDEQLKKVLNELTEWERDKVYDMAARQIEIDLDDGVKVNYAKFKGVIYPVKRLDC